MVNTLNVETITDIARKAGKRILDVYQTADFESITDYKADNSPLTLADKAAHEVIEKELTHFYPEIPILSEEGRAIPYEERKHWKRFWLVDPLDGTKEFIKRNGEFTVNIALIENGEPIMGVVYVPVQDKMYWSHPGGSAFVQEGNASPRPLTVNTFTSKDPGLAFVVSRSHLSPEVKEYIDQYAEPKSISMGSSLKFMVIAEGNAEIYPRLGPTMEWDTGAAHAILKAAGGVIFENESGDPLTYNKENLLNPWFIARGNQTK